jgi:DNA-binding LytR/AlgR family response regulator
MKVLVIESNDFRKNKIITMLEGLGWVLGAELDSFEQIGLYLNIHTPDLIIANMSLGSESVIQQFLVETMQKSIPVLFLVAFDDKEDYNYYLLNPFNPQGLKAAFHLLSNPVTDMPTPLTGIEVRDKQQKKIIPFEDILWIEVERNYCFIKTQNSRYGLIISLSKLMQTLDKRFIQIHRGCVVNSDHIDLVRMSQQEIKINNTVWVIGRLYKANVRDFLTKNQQTNIITIIR